MKDYCLGFMSRYDAEKARCLMHWYAMETGLDRNHAFDGNEMLSDVYAYAANLDMITKDKRSEEGCGKEGSLDADSGSDVPVCQHGGQELEEGL